MIEDAYRKSGDVIQVFLAEAVAESAEVFDVAVGFRAINLLAAEVDEEAALLIVGLEGGGSERDLHFGGCDQ